MNAEELQAIIRELLAVKELRAEVSRRKQRRDYYIRGNPAFVGETNALNEECKIREFRAWNAARAAIR